MVDNYNVKEEEFSNLFGSAKRKKELAATKAELEAVKANQAALQSQLVAAQSLPASSPSVLAASPASKPNLLLWGGIALVVVVGGILLINKK